MDILSGFLCFGSLSWGETLRRLLHVQLPYPKSLSQKELPNVYVIPCNQHESMNVCSNILVLQSGEVTWNRVPLFPSSLVFLVFISLKGGSI